MRYPKILSLSVMLVASSVFAGGFVTNTNQSAHYVRGIAREASTEVDAAYTNPAGTAFMKDGLHNSINNQSFIQARSIKTEYALFENGKKEYEGDVFEPSMPSLFIVYNRGDLALSGGFYIVGGGGTIDYADGFPSFEASLATLPSLLSDAGVKGYSVDMSLTGTSYVMALQLGASYKLFNRVSVYGGGRFNYSYSNYEGVLKNITLTMADGSTIAAATYFNGASQQYAVAAEATEDPTLKATYEAYAERFAGLAQSTADKELECTQTGYGFTPILGLDFNYKRLNVGVKYEHKTEIDLENDTQKNDFGASLPTFADGYKSRGDLPAYLSVGIRYGFLDNFRATIGYHHFFDSYAHFSNNVQDELDHDENEYLLGMEFDMSDRITFSLGGAYTQIFATDESQNNLMFDMSSYSIGWGAAMRLSEHIRMNFGYFFTVYEDWEKEEENYGGSGLTAVTTYDRMSHGIGLGFDLDI